MATITENIFGRSNRRRCVKGRISYTDTSDIILASDEEKVEEEVKDTGNHLEYGFNENLDDVDEVDEEPVTIDLSEFLNENPLLTESSENVADSAGVLTDCHSQFRVTSSVADPSPLTVEATIPTLKDLNINENTAHTEDIPSSEPISEIPPTILSENNVTVDSTDPNKVVNDKSPRKENLLNGVKPSPNKNFKSKPTIASSLLEKYKNFSRLKDFNKNNLRVFGKYPIIKCEKLDIENFVKESNIKVGNWPMQSINNQPKNKSLSSKTTVNKITKSPIRKLSKLLNKPINLNRSLSNSRNASTVKKAQSILIDALKSNSPSLIIKTDNWKPEIASLSDHSSHFIDNSTENFRIPVTQSLNKPVGNHRIIKLVHQKSPVMQMNDSSNQNKKLPIITSINKVANVPKTFQLISPNTFVTAKTEKNKSSSVTPILPKPSSGSIISPVLLKDYTVIQPYVEDPTSPIRPKPLLTVPVDIVPVVDTFNQQGTVTAVPEVHQIIKAPTKSLKPVQSVFLNGGIKQISSPVKISKELPPVNLPVLSHCNTEIPANIVEDKIEEQLQDDSSTVTPKSAVLDALESAFSKPQTKKSPKLKQNLGKQNLPLIGLTANSECQAYNSTLNDMLFGFSDIGDFTDENYSINTSIHIPSEVCNSNTTMQPSDAYQSVQKDALEIQHKSNESTEENHKGIKSFSKHKLLRRKAITSHDSDTLTASEGEDEKNKSQVKLSYTSNRKHKISQKTPEKSSNPNIVSEESDIDFSPKKLILDTEVTENITNQNKKNKFQRRNSSNIPTKNSPKLADQSKEKKSESNTLNSSKSIEKSGISLKSKDDNSQDNAEQNIGKNSNSVKTERFRGKLKGAQKSNGNINNSCGKQKSALKFQRHIVPVIKGRHMVYAHSKFNANTKKSQNTKIVSKKSSRSADIIKEINTITGANQIFGKGSRKKEKIIPLKETNVNNPALPITKTKNDSKTRNAKQNKKNLPVCPKTKKNKTLKVLFKRTTPKQKSKSLEMPFDEICPMLNDKNNSSSLLENNTNLNSSFRDTKNHKVETPGKEENKYNVEILCNNLKSDDSLKENICSEDKILSSEVPANNVVENSVSTDNKDSMNFKNCNNSDLQEKKLITKEHENASEIEDLVTLASKENNIESSTKNMNVTSEDIDNLCLDSKDESVIENICIPINEQNIVDKDLENVKGITSCKEIHNEDHISDVVTQSGIKDDLIISSSEEINKITTTSDDIRSVDHSNMIVQNNDKDDIVSVQYENAKEVSTIFDEEQKQENSPDKVLQTNIEDNILDMLPKDTIETNNDIFAVQKCDHNSDLLLQTNTKDCTVNSDLINNDEIVTICEEIPRQDHNSNGVVPDINEKENEIVTINESDETKVLPSLPEKDVLEEEVKRKKDPKHKRRSCPKIKISVAKTSEDSELTSSSKNWYISERKESTDSSNSEEIAKHNECDNSENIVDEISISPLPVKTFKENNSLIDEIDNNESKNEDKISLNDAIPLELINDSKSPNVSNSASSPCITDDSSVAEKDIDTPVIVSSAKVSDNTNQRELLGSNSKDSVSEKLPVSSTEKGSEEIIDSAASSPSVKIKEESMDINESSVLNSADPSVVNTKLEKEKIAKSLIEVSSDASPSSPSRRNKLPKTDHNLMNPESTAHSGAVREIPKVNKKTKSKKTVLLSTSSDSATAQLSKISQYLESEISKMPASAQRIKGKHFSPEAVIVPFSLGWMRELVHRSTEAKEGKRMSDVYYFSPEGTKLRSMPEISNYLSKHPECKLTLENFTFRKECIYREPFEIERSAKQISVSAASSSKKETSNQSTLKKYFSPTISKSNLTSNKSKENTSKQSLNKKSCVAVKEIKNSLESVKGSGNIDNSNSNDSDCAKLRHQRKKISKVPFDNPPDSKPLLKSSTKIKQQCSSAHLNTSVSDVEVKTTGTVQNKSNSTHTTHLNNEKNSLSKDSSQSKCVSQKRRPKLKLTLSKNVDSIERQLPCTPHCTGANIYPPSVQCAICLCLFHAHCIPKLAEKVIYACRPCTTKKLALYGDERKSVVFPDSVSSDENSTCDISGVDISLLFPEIILNVPCERETFLSKTESNNPYKSFDTTSPSSNIPHEQKNSLCSGGSNSLSSTAVVNMNKPNSVPLHMDTTKNAPCLLPNVLRPIAPRRPNVIPIIRYSSNQMNYPETVLTVVNTDDFPSKVYHVGYGVRLPPGMNISLENSLIIRKLSDGRRVVIRRNSNSSNSHNNVNSNPTQNPATAVNSSHQFLSNISGYINTSFVHGNTKKTLIKSPAETQSNAAVNNTSKEPVQSVPRPCLLNYIRNEKNGSITLQFPESSKKSGTSVTQNALYLVFKKLNVSDLLRASQVCSYWKCLALQNDLWEKVSLNGLTVTNWEKCCLALQKFRTRSLDLRGIVHQDTTNLWEDLKNHMIQLTGIQELIFDQITPLLLKSVAHNVPLLRKLECHFVTTACREPEIWTTSCDVELSSLRYLGRLVRLKIGSGARIILRKGGDSLMPYLPNLRHLALTGFNFTSHMNLESLAQQKELISLELGDCKEIEPGIYAILGTLSNLKRLRLENGGDINDSKLCEALLKIKGLEVLELMNYKISQNLVDSFKELQHLIHVSIWPDNTHKSAVINKNLFTAISNCKDLKYLCWGIIAEGEFTPKVLEMENSDELTYEDLFNRLVALFPECRVEVKSVSRNSWRKFCSTRK